MLCGSQNIVLKGKTIVQANCVIRGDLASVRIGRQCVIQGNAVIRPPWKSSTLKAPPEFQYLTMTIGDMVTIGEGSVVEAAQVGSYVRIGKNCVIGRRCLLKDCSRIEDGAILPPDTVVPPFTVFGGSPARVIRDLPEASKSVHQDLARGYYARFLPNTGSS